MLNDPVHYKFNASVSLSPMTGGAEFGLFADDGGIPPLSVLEFTDGELGWSWSDLAMHNTGWIIHLFNGRAYVVKDLMDYKQKGRCWTNTPSADFINTTLQFGQTVSQHCRHRLPIRGYTLAQLVEMFKTQNCIIASLIDGAGKTRVFAETIRFIEFNMETLCLYDLNSYCADFGERYDPSAKQGFAFWTVREKVDWAMAKLKWDPANHWNLAVAIIDMIRRDLRVLLTLTDTEMLRDTGLHSTWYCDFITAGKQHFLDEHDMERHRARARRDAEPRAVNRELFYQMDVFVGNHPMWVTLSQLEYEMTKWIHSQWLELSTLELKDEAGRGVDDRPVEWIIRTPPWTYAWWGHLRRVDKINLAHSRPYYVSAELGDARLTNELTKPYGSIANNSL